MSAERSWHECSSLSCEFSYEKCSEMFPDVLGLSFVGPEKAHKIPAKLPSRFLCTKSLEVCRRASAGVQGEGHPKTKERNDREVALSNLPTKEHYEKASRDQASLP